ncbi:MAG: hypothetical protein LUD15_03565 [Bacteroides sp.]|nr:hypothetical protein [Bacteroides sp.]
MKIKLYLLLILISAYDLYAAEVKFYSINTIHSTSVRETFAVCKDKNGFIWSSAKTGILRLTEDHCRIYQLPYKTVDITFVKLACEASQLIAYTNNGQIFHYNELYDRFDLLADMRERLTNNYLTLSNIVIDPSGTLWIGSSEGLYHYKEGRLAPVWGLRYPIQHLFFTDRNTLFTPIPMRWLYGIQKHPTIPLSIKTNPNRPFRFPVAITTRKPGCSG